MKRTFITPENQVVIIGEAEEYVRIKSPFLFGCNEKKGFKDFIRGFKEYAKCNGYNIQYTSINSIVPCDLEEKLYGQLIFHSFSEAYRKLNKNYSDDNAKGLRSYFVLRINGQFYCISFLKDIVW